MKKITIILTLFVLLLVSTVCADMGPKPSASVNVTYEGKEITGSFYATMLQYDKDCSRKDRLVYELLYEREQGNMLDVNADEYIKDKITNIQSIDSEFNLLESVGFEEFINKEDWGNKLGNLIIYDSEKDECWAYSSTVWGGNCSGGWCNFNYFLPSTFRLFIYLPEEKKTFMSGVTERAEFKSSYKADLKANGTIQIEETTGIFKAESPINFIFAFLITFVLEVLVVIFYLSIKKITKQDKMVKTVLVANLISLPIVWYVFPLIQKIISINDSTLIIWIILVETFAVLFEGIFIYYLNKDFGKKNAFTMSLLMNLASFLIGGFFALVFGIG